MKRQRYVHGWKGWVQCIYGRDEGDNWRWIEPCSLKEAKKILRGFDKEKQKDYRIYRLVEVNRERRS